MKPQLRREIDVDEIDPQAVRTQVLARARSNRARPEVALVLRGEVRTGIESRSVVLVTDDREVYQLGGAYEHLAGRRVRVEGTVRPHLATTAQHGVAFVVTTIDITDGRD
jgi:hypothetical protein